MLLCYKKYFSLLYIILYFFLRREYSVQDSPRLSCFCTSFLRGPGLLCCGGRAGIQRPRRCHWGSWSYHSRKAADHFQTSSSQAILEIWVQGKMHWMSETFNSNDKSFQTQMFMYDKSFVFCSQFTILTNISDAHHFAISSGLPLLFLCIKWFVWFLP